MLKAYGRSAAPPSALSTRGSCCDSFVKSTTMNARRSPTEPNADSTSPEAPAISSPLAGLLEEGHNLQHLLSTAGSEPRLFLVDYMEPYREYAARVDAQGERKQHAGRLLLYKK